MNRSIVILLISSCFSCSSNNKDTKAQTTFPGWLLETVADSASNHQLVFFFTERMCGECINTEFKNLAASSFPVKPLIIGVFDNHRNFMSTVNIMTSKCRVRYINTADFPEVNIPSPFYFTYDAERHKLTGLFIPEPCNVDSTMKYYQKVLEIQIAKPEQLQK